MAFRALLMSPNTDRGHSATIFGVTLRAYELRWSAGCQGEQKYGCAQCCSVAPG